MQRKRSTSFYLTEEAHQIIDTIANQWGIPKNSVIEISVRLLHLQPERFAALMADSIEQEKNNE